VGSKSGFTVTRVACAISARAYRVLRLGCMTNRKEHSCLAAARLPPEPLIVSKVVRGPARHPAHKPVECTRRLFGRLRLEPVCDNLLNQPAPRPSAALLRRCLRDRPTSFASRLRRGFRPRLFSNSGSGVKLSSDDPCRVQGSLRGRGVPSA
jgi:hypothetical protein